MVRIDELEGGAVLELGMGAGMGGGCLGSLRSTMHQPMEPDLEIRGRDLCVIRHTEIAVKSQPLPEKGEREGWGPSMSP